VSACFPANFYERCLPGCVTEAELVPRSALLLLTTDTSLFDVLAHPATFEQASSQQLKMSNIAYPTAYPIIPPTRMLLWITSQPVRFAVQLRAGETFYSFFLGWAASRNIEVRWHVMDSSRTAVLPVTCVPIRTYHQPKSTLKIANIN
jgi:hypothetical protein